MVPSSKPVSVGDVLAGRYTIVRALGEGGMALVFEGEHVRLGQRVAIKLIRPELAGHAELVTRFEREGRAASRLRSRHAARIFDVDVTEAGVPFLTMELLDGNDLAAELERRGPLPIAEAAGYVIQACAALAEAHALGIIHRDVKPSNLFLTTEGGERIVKVLDFGIATSPLDDDGKLTRTGAVMGTPIYMAPEQFRSAKDVDGRADVWSLGATLYELLGGRPPFDGSAATVGIAIVTEPLPSLTALRPDVPEGLAAAIERALEKNRNARFHDVIELRGALAPFAHGAALTPPATPTRIAPHDAPTLAPRDAVETAHTEIALVRTAPTATKPAAPAVEARRPRRALLALPLAAVAAAVVAFLAWPLHAPVSAPVEAARAVETSAAPPPPPPPPIVVATPPSAAALTPDPPIATGSSRSTVAPPTKVERVPARPSATTPLTATKPPLFYPGN